MKKTAIVSFLVAIGMFGSYTLLSADELGERTSELASYFMGQINGNPTKFYKYVRLPHPYSGSGYTIRADCSGYLFAIYSVAGVSRIKNIKKQVVAVLYNNLKSAGKTYGVKTTPQQGDVIFFDCTWDRNGNGRRDDYLTHVAIVDYVDSAGTVHFYHCVIDENGYASCSTGFGNPDYPTDPSLNYIIGVYGDTYYYAGELFRCYGSIR